jgi:predicted transposase YbfD/YdcC
MNGLTLLDHISIIKDPRQNWKVAHKLSDIIFLAIVAVIAGAEGWEEIEDFGHDKLEWLKQYGDFENGVPVHDTIARVVSMINPKQFQTCFIAWMKDCHTATKGDVIAIDGKTVRGSYDKSKKRGAIHMVSAFSAANEVVLGQIKTQEKSNEITAIPELLKLLDIRGCLVTIDAMGCQKKIASKILECKADYLLAVKGNQKRLEQAFDNIFDLKDLQDSLDNTYATQEMSRGRLETRLHKVSHDINALGDLAFEWPGLKTLGYAVSFRQEDGKPATSASIRYYISSAKLSAKDFAHAIREHWSIEVKLHWKLDTAFREDACRIRRGDGAENFAKIRHVALNLLNAEKSFSGGIKRKQKRANRSESYLSQVLTGQGAS